MNADVNSTVKKAEKAIRKLESRLGVLEDHLGYSDYDDQVFEQFRIHKDELSSSLARMYEFFKEDLVPEE
ncbi:MAG: hypothetical protein HQL95_02235 [Magnetococcales bacterium]|nr:hypothetical protein [Magnetococcales bacterium]